MPVRLSRFLVFVPYGGDVEVQHTVRATTERIPRTEHARLQKYAGFRELQGGDDAYRDRGWLVAQGEDTVTAHGGLRAGSEAQLDRDYQDWYWAREVESERELRWLGVVVLKMPTDLFVYQALISREGIRSVLEIGAGDGGGLWFFASILAMRGGGEVVGVENDPPDHWPAFTQFANVDVAVEVADALSVTVPDARFGLVVIDVGRGGPWADLLRRWAPAVTKGGFLVVEDVADEDWVELDSFLLAAREFGLEMVGLPMRKAVVLQRGNPYIKEP